MLLFIVDERSRVPVLMLLEGYCYFYIIDYCLLDEFFTLLFDPVLGLVGLLRP